MLTERERRSLLGRAAVEKKLLRLHPELTDGMLELLVQAAERARGLQAYVAGVEKSWISGVS